MVVIDGPDPSSFFAVTAHTVSLQPWCQIITFKQTVNFCPKNSTCYLRLQVLYITQNIHYMHQAALKETTAFNYSNYLSNGSEAKRSPASVLLEHPLSFHKHYTIHL